LEGFKKYSFFSTGTGKLSLPRTDDVANLLPVLLLSLYALGRTAEELRLQVSGVKDARTAHTHKRENYGK
jgi:hypothetical protein